MLSFYLRFGKQREGAMDKKKTTNTTNEENSENKTQHQRPKKGLEDWEMLQTREEPPLKIPYWVPIIIVGMLAGAVLLSFPLTGVRGGYERPWFDNGLVIGVGYGLLALLVIYFILRKKKNTVETNESDELKKK